MISEKKITTGEINDSHVQSQPDRLTGTATQNKAVFDTLGELIAAKYNGLIDELTIEFDTTNTSIATLDTDVNTRITVLGTSTDTKFANVELEIGTLSTYVDTQDNSIKASVTLLSDAIDVKLNAINERIGEIEREPGPQGETGPIGLTGPQGERGPQGIQGEQGYQGVDGPKGATGATGSVGPKGEKGDVGATGPRGYDGEQGIQGIQGERGPQGIDGRSFEISGIYATLTDLQTAYPTGDGANAYAVGTSESNYIYIYDTEWENIGQLQGPKGEKGEKGDTGEQGIRGETGLQGEQGIEGVRGPKGLTGDKGDTGEKGADGIQGPQGIQGEQGEKGDKGDTVPTDDALSSSSTNAIANNVVTVALSGKEPVFTKKTAFNRDFETVSANISAETLTSISSAGSSLKLAKADHQHDMSNIKNAIDLKADTSTVNNDLNLKADKTYVDTQVASKEDVAEYEPSTIGTNWSTDSPSHYDGFNGLRYRDYNIEIQISHSVTEAQLKAWQEAQITGSYTDNTLYALGTKPTISIPVYLKTTRKVRR